MAARTEYPRSFVSFSFNGEFGGSFGKPGHHVDSRAVFEFMAFHTTIRTGGGFRTMGNVMSLLTAPNARAFVTRLARNPDNAAAKACWRFVQWHCKFTLWFCDGG